MRRPWRTTTGGWHTETHHTHAHHHHESSDRRVFVFFVFASEAVVHPILRRRACKDSFREQKPIVRKQRILLAGFVARMEDERLPQRVMFGELIGGKGYSGGQDKD